MTARRIAPQRNTILVAMEAFGILAHETHRSLAILHLHGERRNIAVTILQRSGSYVRKYSKEEIEALFDFREALEVVVIKRAIKNAAALDMRQFICAFRESLENLSTESLADKMRIADDIQQKFHAYLWEQCPDIIYNEIRNVMLLTRQITVRHINFCTKRDNALEIARNEVMVHIAIAEAIERGDETRALEGIREDISGTKDDILKNFEAIEEQEVIF